MKRWFVEIAFAALVLTLTPGVCTAAAPSNELRLLADEINSFHMAKARKHLEQLDDNLKQSAECKYLTGRLLFFEGDFDGALKKVFEAIELSKAESNWKIFRDRVIISKNASTQLTPIPSDDGQIVFYVSKNVDKILIPYAKRSLNAQIDALEKVFGDKPDWPLTVMILPDVESLAGVSGLTLEQIERTGTVGVTKYGRIMIVSPRALAEGYPWLDTLAHELVHVIITRLSNNKAPIWFHEGLAKLLERRWRDQPISDLTPEEAYLLDRAAKERRLIPLRRFHPSISFLPNQEDAALAYAQVLSFLMYLNNKFENEPKWMRQLLISLSKNESLDQAFINLSKFNIRKLYLWWRQTVSGRRQTPVPAIDLMKKRFQRGATTGQISVESMLAPKIKRIMRLGDLLRLRGHIMPAVVEYKKALTQGATTSSEISDRLGACLLQLGKHAEAIKFLKSMTSLYPFHSTVFIQLGEALAAVRRRPEAIDALKQAIAINPFHPDIHCRLSRLLDSEGKDNLAAKELEQCHILASRSAPNKD